MILRGAAIANGRLRRSFARFRFTRARDLSGKSDRTASAFHEAGHAVVRLLHGLTFDRAYINSDGTGAVEIGRSPRGQPGGAAIRALAGPVAEARYSGQPLAEILADQAKVDHDHARAALAAAGRSEDEAEAIAIAEKLVAWAWAPISAIAALIDANGEIRQGRAIAIINGCLDDLDGVE
jgi:hypothetical protein